MNKSDRQIFKKVLEWCRSQKPIIRSTQIIDKSAYSVPRKMYITPTITKWDELGKFK